MTSLQHKIDFVLTFAVENANPNGDPLNGNRPRTTAEGLGEMSDVAEKRKIRNRLQDAGERIFVQSTDRTDDGEKSLSDRWKAFTKTLSKTRRTEKLYPTELANSGLMSAPLDKCLRSKERKRKAMLPSPFQCAVRSPYNLHSLLNPSLLTTYKSPSQ